MIRGRVIVIAKAISPIHHGSETVGNVSMFRKQDVYVHGSKFSVPYISGNSVKAANRRASAGFSLAALGFDSEQVLNRSEVNLLRSGGAMTKSGTSVRLDTARDVSQELPVLGLHGYAAGNAMQESMVAVDFLEPLCWETAAKYARELEGCVHVADRHMVHEPASELLKVYDEYARDGSRDRAGFALMSGEDQEALATGLADGGEKDPYRPMPHSFECLVPGTVLIGGYTFTEGITEDELQAWRAGIMWASEGVSGDGGLVMRFGGKSARGFGKVSVHLHGYLAHGIEPVKEYKTDELISGPDPDEELLAFAARLKVRRDEVKAALEGVTR